MKSRIFLIGVLTFFSVYFYAGESAVFDRINDSLLSSDINALSDVLSDMININMTIPRATSGIYSRNYVLGLFRDIFSRYETLSLNLLYSNIEKSSSFYAYEWTLKERSSILIIRIFFTVEGKYIIRIRNVDK